MNDTAGGKDMAEILRQLKKPFKWIRDKFRQIKWCVQRAKRGFSDPDLWDLGDTTVALIIKMLTEFQKNNTEGYPLCFEVEFFEEFKDEIGCDYEEFRRVPETPPMKAWRELEYKECRKKWHDTIDEMIALFSEAQDENLSWDHRLESCERAFSQFGKWAQYLWL